MNRIKELRKQSKMKQSDLAEALNLVPSTISGWEVGRNEPDYDTLRKLSEIFDCSIDYILGGEQKKIPAAVSGDELVLTEAERDLLYAYRASPAHIKAIVETALSPYLQEAESPISRAE